MDYRINIDTNDLVADTGSLGRFFFTASWRVATEKEVTDYLFVDEKAAKFSELKSKLGSFFTAGFSYGGATFSFDAGAVGNFTVKEGVDSSSVIKYQFCDVTGKPHDFEDQAGLAAFFSAARTEHDRVMFKYNEYKPQIAACSTSAELAAIVIDFTA